MVSSNRRLAARPAAIRKFHESRCRTIPNRLPGVRKVNAGTDRVHAMTMLDGVRVMEGRVSFERNGSTLNVWQDSQRAIVEWKGFGIGTGERIVVRQPHRSSSMLVRVPGEGAIRIDGGLDANGRLHLWNRGGAIIDSEGVIDATSLTVDTLDAHDEPHGGEEDFRFSGDDRPGIFNLGSICAAGGNVSLFSHLVRNDGVIRAVEGSVEMLAGKVAPLASPYLAAIPVGRNGVRIDATAVANTGVIEAARVRLRVARGDLYTLAIDQSGVIRAIGEGGCIVLSAEGGTVRQDGRLTARNADGSGGDILIGGDGQAPGEAITHAGRIVVTGNARMEAGAEGGNGNGGRVIIRAGGSTTFAGRIEAGAGKRSGDGGFVEVSGKHALEFHPDLPIDLSAPKGKAGTVLLGSGEMTVVAVVTAANQIVAATVEAGLAGANYMITTSGFDPGNSSGSINITSDVGWRSPHMLTLRSGNAIGIDANMTALHGALEMYAGRYAEAPPDSGLCNVSGGAWVTEGHVLQVDRLRYGANVDDPPSGYTVDPDPHTANFWADGNLRVNTLELDLGGGAGLSTLGDANAVGAFRTIGSGSLGWVSVTNHRGDLDLYLNSQDAFGMQIVTSGDLRLEAGSQVTSTWGDIVLVSKGGNFINQATGAVLGFTRRGSRFLIYSGSDAGTIKGGMTGRDEFSRSFAGRPPSEYGDDVSYFFYRETARMFQP